MNNQHLRSASECINGVAPNIQLNNQQPNNNNRHFQERQFNTQHFNNNDNQNRNLDNGNANLADADTNPYGNTSHVLIHSDSQRSLDQLFDLNTSQNSVPLRNRNLPNSFFNPSTSQSSLNNVPRSHSRSTSFNQITAAQNRPYRSHMRTQSTIVPMSSISEPQPMQLGMNINNQSQTDINSNQANLANHNQQPQQYQLEGRDNFTHGQSQTNNLNQLLSAQPAINPSGIPNIHQNGNIINSPIAAPRSQNHSHASHFRNFSSPNFGFNQNIHHHLGSVMEPFESAASSNTVSQESLRDNLVTSTDQAMQPQSNISSLDRIDREMSTSYFIYGQEQADGNQMLECMNVDQVTQPVEPTQGSFNVPQSAPYMHPRF